MSQEDHDLLIEMRGDLKDLVTLVKRGNGQPSLISRVSSLETWRSMLVGAWLLVMAAVTIYAAVKGK